MGLDITPEQQLYMCAGYNGQVLGAFGQTGKRPGDFLFVHNLAVASDGAIYTAEILNWRPQKFVPRQVSEARSRGGVPLPAGQFHLHYGVTADRRVGVQVHIDGMGVRGQVEVPRP